MSSFSPRRKTVTLRSCSPNNTGLLRLKEMMVEVDSVLEEAFEVVDVESDEFNEVEGDVVKK